MHIDDIIETLDNSGELNETEWALFYQYISTELGME